MNAVARLAAAVAMTAVLMLAGAFVAVFEESAPMPAQIAAAPTVR
jgi:hypothetical protein